MKILWIYNHKPQKEYDTWLHLEFAKKLAEYHEVIVYGTNVHFFYPELCNKGKLRWDEKTTLADIYKEHYFDVVIADTKNRMFTHYRPSLYPYDNRPEERGKCLLPSDFVSWNKTPKICLEEDYQYETDTSWYKEMRFDLLLHRHASNWLRTVKDESLPSLWFPFSVDTDIFHPTDEPREKKVLFAMNSDHEVYTDRRAVRKNLARAGIISDFGADSKYEDYVRNLQTHRVVVNGSGLYQITPAKVFEIIASGAVLLTDDSPNTGLDILFPSAHVTYKKDGSDVVDKANELLNNEGKVRSLVEKGLKFIESNHTHKVRIEQLTDEINALQRGRT